MDKKTLTWEIYQKKKELERVNSFKMDNFSNLMQRKKVKDELFYLLDKFFEESEKQ